MSRPSRRIRPPWVARAPVVRSSVTSSSARSSGHHRVSDADRGADRAQRLLALVVQADRLHDGGRQLPLPGDQAADLGVVGAEDGLLDVEQRPSSAEAARAEHVEHLGPEVRGVDLPGCCSSAAVPAPAGTGWTWPSPRGRLVDPGATTRPQRVLGEAVGGQGAADPVRRRWRTAPVTAGRRRRAAWPPREPCGPAPRGRWTPSWPAGSSSATSAWSSETTSTTSPIA